MISVRTPFTKTALLAACLVLVGATSSCGQLNRQTTVQIHAATRAIIDPASIYATVLKESTELQGTMVDGWFHGEDSRSLKTEYAKASPTVKAKFACDYQTMLSQNKQDMVNQWQSYVPWSKRAAFARKWWSDPKNSSQSETFLKADRWKQILWMQESLRDGSELWWRAYEQQFPEGIDSAAAMAHESEQDMVTNFKESENSSPRSFSALNKNDY
jgi:hypothetical protein